MDASAKQRTDVDTGISASGFSARQRHFFWEECVSCPEGYPVHIVSGKFNLMDGSVCSLALGFCSGLEGWGAPGSGLSASVRSMPEHIDVTWFSLAEKRCYHLHAKINTDLIGQLFEKGYIHDKENRSPQRLTYDMINVGLAPGGLVVIWLCGPGRQTEVGCYGAGPCLIEVRDLTKLPAEYQYLFDWDQIDELMNDLGIVSPAGATADIPFDKWMGYRKHLQWRPQFFGPESPIVTEFACRFFNGEEVRLSAAEIRNEVLLTRLPATIEYNWKTSSGRRFCGAIWFNETEIFSFSSSSGDEASDSFSLELEVNHGLTVVMTRFKRFKDVYRLKKAVSSIRELN
ncbi:DUF2931 family protein [Pedobacter sp. SYP-B3415]|uniref:DUF2931 family protein n=1 Tax=Pedobacter sp. SYP-B3415 TaxID=2496641 RepID=UPI00101D3B76|nr:DUF2931 family protein [Pedobacter sp. SYP-B3415]